MVDWDDLPPPNLEVVERGIVTITSGGTETIADVADEGDDLIVAFGHQPSSADGSAVTYHIDDNNANGTVNVIFDESAAGGDSVIDYTIIRVNP